MKVIIAYSYWPPITDYLKRAFEKKGVEAHIFYSDTNTLFDRYFIKHLNKMAHNLRVVPKSRTLLGDSPLAHLHYRGAKLLEKVREIRPDMVFIVRGWRYTEEVMREIRKTSAVFGWWIEREERVAEPLKEAALFDHYFFMNSFCLNEARKAGFAQTSLLHHSVCTEAFYPIDSQKKYDWSFVGACSPKRMEYIKKALEVSRNAAIYGPNWLKKNPFDASLYRTVKGKRIGGRPLVELYNQSKVVLNVTNWGFGEGRKRSGMNMRVLEVPACRAFLLTDGSADLENVVTPGKHVAVYEGLKDFSEKLSLYLKKDDLRDGIARDGYSHVVERYTYDDLVGDVLKVYAGLGKGAYAQ